jgi:hypothetical protein
MAFDSLRNTNRERPRIFSRPHVLLYIMPASRRQSRLRLLLKLLGHHAPAGRGLRPSHLLSAASHRAQDTARVTRAANGICTTVGLGATWAPGTETLGNGDEDVRPTQYAISLDASLLCVPERCAPGFANCIHPLLRPSVKWQTNPPLPVHPT